MPKTPHNTIMWELTPPPGVTIQQWQASFRVMFKGERLEEMLDWLDWQVQNIKDNMEQGKFYNEQPRAAQAPHIASQRNSRAGKARPEGVHANHSSMQRRREPRRGEDDEANPDTPPPPRQRQQIPQAQGKVQRLAGDVPMAPLTPTMAKPANPMISKPLPKPASVAGPVPKVTPGETKEARIARLQKELETAKAEPEVEYEEMQEAGENTQAEPEAEAPESPAEKETPEPEPDLSGPRNYRHRWSGGSYVIGDVCVKCGTECTGTEELCPVP